MPWTPGKMRQFQALCVEALEKIARRTQEFRDAGRGQRAGDLRERLLGLATATESLVGTLNAVASFSLEFGRSLIEEERDNLQLLELSRKLFDAASQADEEIAGAAFKAAQAGYDAGRGLIDFRGEFFFDTATLLVGVLIENILDNDQDAFAWEAVRTAILATLILIGGGLVGEKMHAAVFFKEAIEAGAKVVMPRARPPREVSEYLTFLEDYGDAIEMWKKAFAPIFSVWIPALAANRGEIPSRGAPHAP